MQLKRFFNFAISFFPITVANYKCNNLEILSLKHFGVILIFLYLARFEKHFGLYLI